MRRSPLRLLAVVCGLALLAGCSGAPRVQPPPAPASPGPSAAPGVASFFFPVEIPLAEVERALEAEVPKHLVGEERQEIAKAIEEDFYRYDLQRGPFTVGTSGEWITFSIPFQGTVTVGGRLRPVPLGRGLPVRETVELAGRIVGTASPAVGPDWRPDPRPAVQLVLDRADLKVFKVVPLDVRSFLEARLNPVLNRELRRSAGRWVDALALRARAEAAWRSLFVSRRLVGGESVWLRFEPAAVSLAPVAASGGTLRTGLGISGRVSLTAGSPPPAPVPAPLPPLGAAAPAPGFTLEVPVAASAEELSRWVERDLRGFRFRDRSREMTITAASLAGEGDRLALALDFATGEKPPRTGRLLLRGRPAVDPGGRVLRLADLDYDLESGSLLLRLFGRLHRDELRERLAKAARVDLSPVLERAGREAVRSLGELLPPASRSGVRVEPVLVTDVGVSGGAVWARCRVSGSTPPLGLESITRAVRF